MQMIETVTVMKRRIHQMRRCKISIQAIVTPTARAHSERKILQCAHTEAPYPKRMVNLRPPVCWSTTTNVRLTCRCRLHEYVSLTPAFVYTKQLVLESFLRDENPAEAAATCS